MQCLMLILLSQGWEDGWGIVMGILANCNGLSPSSSHIAPNVATGLAVAGLEPEFVARMAIANHPDALDYASPPSATAITPDPIMVLRQARNVETAGRFVVFVLSPEGQRLWALSPDAGGPLSGPLYRYPVRPDTYKEYEGKLTVKVNPFEAQAGFQIDPDAEAAYTKLLPHLFTAACGKNHLLLQQAWRTARQRGEDWPGWAELRRPLLTREEAVAAAVECGESSQRARDLEAEWSEAFRRRYQAAIATTAAAAR
jgi:hypothetical protein